MRARASQHRPLAKSRGAAPRTAALFGWGNKGGKSDAELAKEEQYRVQQEILRRRKTGEAIEEAKERRRKVAETVAARKVERQAERDSLAQGVVPESMLKWKPYNTKEDEEARTGIVVPLLPFGNVKYDEGERFDLRSPYADDGWVDPDETDAWSGFRKLWPFGPKKEIEKPGERKIVWASQYNKWKQERQQAQDAKGKK